jgi:hypothetical protein
MVTPTIDAAFSFFLLLLLLLLNWTECRENAVLHKRATLHCFLAQPSTEKKTPFNTRPTD